MLAIIHYCYIMYVAMYCIYTITVDNESISVPPAMIDGEDCSQSLMILAGVFFVTSVITITISTILACRLCSLKRKNGMMYSSYLHMNITINVVILCITIKKLFCRCCSNSSSSSIAKTTQCG